MYVYTELYEELYFYFDWHNGKKSEREKEEQQR